MELIRSIFPTIENTEKEYMMHKHVRNIMSCGINLERQFYLVLDIKKMFADLVSSWYLSSRSKLSTYNTTHDKMFNFKTVLYMNQFNCWCTLKEHSCLYIIHSRFEISLNDQYWYILCMYVCI